MGERNRYRARQDDGAANFGTDTVGAAKGVRGRTVNRAAILVGQLVQVQVHIDSRVDVSAHGFWKQDITVMIEI